MNFNFLGLKKLIATCYMGSPVIGEQFEQLSLFDIIQNKDNTPEKHPYKIEITELTDVNGDGAIDLSDVEYLLRNNKNALTLLKGNGDFRSEECVEILKQADIVVTNPPFSLFREYVAQLVNYGKQFLIIGNVNAITYKEIFALIKANILWMGYSIHSGDREFRVPNDYQLNAANARIDENGNKYIRVKGVRWFTNMDYIERHTDIDLWKNYNEEEYPNYKNYDAINVDVSANIPTDYYGVMGVPITFLDKYNPEQFEIIALGIVGSCNFTSNRRMEILKNGKGTGKYTLNAKGTLYRAFNPQKDNFPAFRDEETGELYSSIYARVLIRRKQNEN